MVNNNTDLFRDRRTTGIVALAAGILCWGISPVLIRRLTPFVDAWTANGLRYPIAAALYWPVLWSMYRAGKLHGDLIRRCLVPALLSTLGQVFWSLAHYELQASEIGFFARMSTAWAILGSMVLFADERRMVTRPRFLIGLATIATGFLVMSCFSSDLDISHDSSTQAITVTPDETGNTVPVHAMAASIPQTKVRNHGIPAGNYLLGITFALMASCFFGTYMVSIRWFVSHENPIHVFGVVGQFVSIGMILGMFAYGDVFSVSRQTTFSWSLIVSSAILGIGCGHVLVYTAVQRLGASLTTSCQAVLPFVTATVAAVILSERLVTQQWFGGTTMIVGAFLLLSMKHEIDTAPSNLQHATNRP